MRLTLRTLLAFLDHAPLPNDEREPIQRVLDSNPAAEELVQRIRRVLTQPRLASPAVETAGVLQANQVAEYLDGTLDMGLTKRLEQICMTNDSALSEIAALHQILTDWIDKPAPISEGLRQRLYQLAPGEASLAESEADPQRAAGREALQSAASLLEIRPWEGTASATEGAGDSQDAGKVGLRGDARGDGHGDWRSKPMPASRLERAEASEERSAGGWFLVLLLLVGVGFMWWNQRPMWFVPEMFVQLPMEGALVETLPAESLDDLRETAEEVTIGDLKPSTAALDGPALDEPTLQRTAPSATLPPIQLSSASSGVAATGAEAMDFGSTALGMTASSSAGLGAVSPLVAEGLPALPPPSLDQPVASLAEAKEMIPDFAPETELATDPLGDALLTPALPLSDMGLTTRDLPTFSDSSVAAGLPAGTGLPLAGGSSVAMGGDPFPLAELNSPPVNSPPVDSEPMSSEPVVSAPLISALPPVDDELSGGLLLAATLPPATMVTPLPDSAGGLGAMASESVASVGGNPLVPAPLATTSSASEPAVAMAGPLEWGQQVGTVVIENGATRDPHDEWIVVLPGGRSKLQVRSPRGNSWDFVFSGVSRYQLQEQQGLPQLNVQRCFMIFRCNSPDESLEIQTPKGKLWITSLTPQAEVVLELRPFLPQGFTAQETAPRYYLGCLGIEGRVMIEHQQREEVVFANKWFVVRPEGEVETFQAELTPGIAQALTDLRSDVIAPEVSRLSGLVQSEAGMEELFSLASGQHPEALQTATEVRSLAGMWSYCLGQMEPAFAILNDPQMKDYWDVHIQAVISLLQSEPSTAGLLETAAARHAGPTYVARRFVGLNPQTVTRSQVAELVNDLEHAQVARRVLAIHALKTLTKETYGFEPNRSTAMNQTAVQRWRQWLQDSAQSRISVNPTGSLVPSAQR